MSDVEDGELLARFIFSKQFVRADNTLRQGAFVPYPYGGLSVTRNKDLSESEITQVARVIEAQRGKALIGRGDVGAEVYRTESLDVLLDPVETNPHHVSIQGWPPNKEDQMIIAKVIANKATYVAMR